MDFKLSSIFSRNAVPENNLTSATIHDGYISSQNREHIQENETCHQYGIRMCGYANGNIQSLKVFFQRVISDQKTKFARDKVRQEKAKEDIMKKIIAEESNRQKAENNLANIQRQIEETDQKIQVNNDKITELKSTDRKKNKESSVKFTFGTVILVIMTIYLFVFYSSTFYSAFFGASTVTDLNKAMFNSAAIAQSWHSGIGAFLFVITAPVIFMGLGYALHYFSTQEGALKYFKISGCIIVTFMFDCLMAYSIAEKCYNFQVINSMNDMPPFTMSVAMTDVNVWIVIFCGFVTYMIWGIILDMVISAYNEMVSNKESIEKLRNQNKRLEDSKAEHQNNAFTVKNNIADIDGRIQQLQASLNSIRLPLSEIQQAISDFFSGWTQLIGALKQTDYDYPAAQKVYQEFLDSLSTKAPIS